MKITAVYPGTFDPITNGHSDIISRASALFDHIIVAVARSTSKTTAFTTDERVAMAHNVLVKFKNVEVRSFDGLMTVFARENKAKVIIRGLRAVSDFEYEFQMASMNNKLYPDAETVYLTPTEQFSYISSSLIREIAHYNGDVSPFVHPDVQEALKERLAN